MFKKKLEETKVIFFDLDGTLIDTEKIYFKFWDSGFFLYTSAKHAGYHYGTITVSDCG